MSHATHCKFCKKPITVAIDDSYAALGDPHKVIPMAACNHCADVRVRRRQLESTLQQQCYSVQLLNSARVEVPDKARKNLGFLVKQYGELIDDWNHTEEMVFDEAVVDALLKKPEEWGNIIGRLWRAHSSWKQHQSQAELRQELGVVA